MAEAVIIGSGAIGLSTAFYLSKAGYRDIVVLEQSSSLGGFNTLRCAGGFRYQFSQKINIEMSQLSRKLMWELNWQRKESYHVNSCGYLFLLTESEKIETYKKSIQLQNSLGVPTEWICAKNIRERYPMLSIEDVVGGTFCKDDFLMNPTDLISSYISELRKNGVKLYTNAKVVDIEMTENRISGVRVNNEIIHTPVLINATGSWSTEINKMVGSKLPIIPSKQQLFITNKVNFVDDSFPVIIFVKDNLGIHKEGDGILTGLTREQGNCRDILMDKKVDFDWEIRHCRVLLDRVSGLAANHIISSWVGFYDMTPDELPIISQMPGIKGFYCNAGFSGHGFMHSPAAGFLMAELVANGQISSLSGEEFNMNRFEKLCQNRTSEYYKI